MDVSLVIKQRLSELGLDQKDLAAASQVTESYISQLLTRRKAPPAPGRTDIYDRIGEFLRLPSGELSKLADAQRQEDLKKRVVQAPGPLFKECRELLLRKCGAEHQKEIRRIFERDPFGELERLITQKVLDVAQGVAKDELGSEAWLRSMAQVSGRSYEQMRVAVLEFLDTDAFNISLENCVSFLDPMIDSWDIDLRTFAMKVALNPRLTPGRVKRFEFIEQGAEPPYAAEPGFAQFLQDKSLSGDATEEEIEFLKTLKFKARRPAALYYYRELQNLRDPLHFPVVSRRPGVK
ncbi:MAG TPA: helix-turn-helix transcriptional regulator [Bryobacteraceae bacterium]|jgi:transcriptional regulator with XRE-family HTH domain